MTSLNGYIQGLGSGADRIVRKTGDNIKLSVFDNIDRVIVFNEAGETSQETNDGRNLFAGDASSLSNVSYIDGVIENTDVDSRNEFYSIVRIRQGSTIVVGTGPNIINQTGRYSYTLTPTSAGNNIAIYHQCGTSGMYMVAIFHMSFEANQTYTISFDVDGYNPSVLGGLVISKIQVEKNDHATPYQPYCGGIPSPNPSYPQKVEGIGFKQQDGTYTVRIDYDDGDEHFGSITASGLAYPLYEGDVLDFVNGKVIRANGYKKFDGSETWADYSDYGLGFQITISDLISQTFGDGKSNRFIRATDSSEMTTKTNVVKFGDNNNKVYFAQLSISGVSDLATWKTYLQNNETYIVYPLATPTDEYITLSGDISDIGTATVTADGTLTVKYDKVEMAIRKYS